MKKVLLNTGNFVFVDDCDFDEVSKFKWSEDRRSEYVVYAKRFEEKTVKGIRTRKSIYLHRQLMGVTGRSILVDHKNGQTLDCQRQNLRVCTMAENIRNSRIGKNNTHGFKGIVKRPSGRWGSYITLNYKNLCIGTFDTPEEAARAYDEAAKIHHKAFANLNFK